MSGTYITIEGWCTGMAITDDQARAVMEYIERGGGAPPATPVAQPAEPLSDAEAMDTILAHAVPGVALTPDPRAVELGLVAAPPADGPCAAAPAAPKGGEA